MEYKIPITDKLNELFYVIGQEKIDIHNDYFCYKIEILESEFCFSFSKMRNPEHKVTSTVESLKIRFNDIRNAESNIDVVPMSNTRILINMDLGRFQGNNGFSETRDGYYYFSIEFDDILSFSFEAKELYFDF